MKRTLGTLGVVAAIAAAVHVAALWAIPRAIMGRLMDQGALEAGGVNRFAHKPRVTAETDRIVRESPDLAYSYCVYDLSSGPVRVQVPLSPPYTSVALHASNTDNFFVTNDRDHGRSQVDLVLVTDGQRPATVPEGARVVRVPEARGLVLVRRVIERAEAFASVDAVRRAARCEPLR